MNHRLLAGTTVAVAALCAGAGTASAEPTARATGHDQLEEMVVRARKRDEAISDVPTSITAFGSEDIDRYNLTTIDQLATFTPGLIVAESSVSSGGSISLRGVGTGDTNYLADQAVAINVDGMQVGSLNVRKNAQIDLDQIEVLRGPQALFFGKNSPGGVIAFRSADPGPSREIAFETGHEAVSGDTYYQALFSSPLSDTVGARFVARYSDLDGYFNLRTVPANGDPLVIPPHVSSWPSGEEIMLRGTLLADSADNLTVRAKITYNESKIEGGSITAYQRFDCPLGMPQLQPSFPCVLDDDIYLGGAPIEYLDVVSNAPSDNGIGLRNNDQLLSTLEIEYAISPELAFTSLTGLYDFNETNAHNASVGPRATVLVPHLPFDLRQVTQEFRLTSDSDSAINFMVGVFLERQDTASSQDGVLTIFGAPFAFGEEAVSQDQQASSVFGNVLWDVTETLEVSVGLRHSHEEKELEFFYNGTDLTQNLATDELSFNNLSPEVTVSYDLTDEIMLFGSYKEGFKSGGFDAGFSRGGILTPGFTNTFAEERVDGFEGGIKALFNGTLALNVTAYRYEYQDLQIGSYDAETVTFKVTNAAAATVQGAEADITWQAPVDGLRLFGSLALNDGEFDDFLSGCYVGQSIADGCDRTINEATGAFVEQDLSGRRMHRAPKLGMTAGISFARTLSNGLGLDLSLQGVYSDDYFANLRQSPADLQDSYGKLNASIRLFSPSDRFAVELLAFNLTDEYTMTSSGAVTLTGGGAGTTSGVLSDRSAVVSKGREFLLKLTYRPTAE